MATKSPAKVAKKAVKPLSERAWKALTPRQKKANDPKRYDKEVKAAAKAKEAEKKAALKAKEKAKKDAEKAKAKKLADAAKAKAKKSAGATTKTVVKKTLGKVKDAVKKVSTKAKKTIADSTTATPAVDAQPRITKARMEYGLEGDAKTYLIVAEKPFDNSDCQIGVRNINGLYRIHAFPDFASHGITDAGYTSALKRPANSHRKGYQTRWVGNAEFIGFMNKLRESNQHAHIVDRLLIERLSAKADQLQEAVAS